MAKSKKKTVIENAKKQAKDMKGNSAYLESRADELIRKNNERNNQLAGKGAASSSSSKGNSDRPQMEKSKVMVSGDWLGSRADRLINYNRSLNEYYGKQKEKAALQRKNTATIRKMQQQDPISALLNGNKRREQLQEEAGARAGFVDRYTFGQLPEINRRNAEYQAQQKRNERVDALLKVQGTRNAVDKAQTAGERRNALQEAAKNAGENRFVVEDIEDFEPKSRQQGLDRPYNQAAAESKMDSWAGKARQEDFDRYMLALKAQGVQDKLADAYENLGGWMDGTTKEYRSAMDYESARGDLQTIDAAIKEGLYNGGTDPDRMNTAGRNDLRRNLENQNIALNGWLSNEQNLRNSIAERQESISKLSDEELLKKYGSGYRKYLSDNGLMMNENGSIMTKDGQGVDESRYGIRTYVDMLFDQEYSEFENEADYRRRQIEINNDKINEIARYDELDQKYKNIMDPNVRLSRRNELENELKGKRSELEEIEAKMEAWTGDGDLLYADLLNKAQQLDDEIENAEAELKLLDNYAEKSNGAPGSSKYRAEWDKGATSLSEDPRQWDIYSTSVDRVWSFLNGGQEYDAYTEAAGAKFQMSNAYNNAMAMLPEEKQEFNRLYAMAMEEGREPAEAKAFLEALQPYLTQRLRTYEELQNRMLAREMPISSTLGSLAVTAVEPLLALRTGYGILTGEEAAKDPNSYLFKGARYQGDVEGQIAQDLGGTGGFLYKATMSGLKNFVRGLEAMGTGGAAPAVTLMEFAGEAFYTSYQDKLEKTGDENTAAASALLDAAISTFFEVASIEKMFSDPKSMMNYILQNMGAEMSEEFFEGVFSPYIHKFFEGSNEWEDRAKEIQAAGGYYDGSGNWIQVNKDNAKEAMAQALREYNGQLVESVGSAALSVGGPAAFGAVRNIAGDYRENAAIGKEIINSGMTGNENRGEKLGAQAKNEMMLFEATSKIGENSKSAIMARNMLDKLKKGGKVNNAEYGRLVKSIISESSEEIGNIAQNVLGNSIEQALKDRNVKDAETVGALITNTILSGEATPEFLQAIAEDKGALEVWNEFKDNENPVKAFNEQAKGALEARNSVMEMITEPEKKARNITEKAIGNLMKGAKWATKEEIAAADAAGGKTGSATEIIHDGKYAEITGFGTREVEEEGKKIQVATVTLSNGKTVDLADIRPTSETQAQILQFVQSDGGSTIMTETGKALMQIGGQVQNLASAVTDTVNLVFDMFTGKKNTKIHLDTETEQEIRTAVQKDMDAADAARLNNYVELKPGSGRTTFNGVAYGSKGFDVALKAAGISKNVRNEANAIASISKSLGTNVELYYDANESGNQGAFYGGQGIRINLAGTYNSEGVHRSALATFAHEVTHNLEANSAEAYKGLRRFVLQNLGKMGMNLQAELQRIMKNYAAHNENINLSGAVAEIVAMGSEQVLTNENVVRQLKEEDPSLFGKVKGAVQEMVNRIRLARNTAQETSSRYAKALQAINDQVGKVWLAAAKEAQGAQGVAEGTGTAEYSFMGTDPETGKSVYMSNFGNNVQNDNKRYHIVKLVRKVFSQQPISLTIKENGVEKQIQAQFNPDFDYTLKRDTDLLKLAFKNKMGSPHERTVMLNLADDYYQILQEASYDNWQPNKKDRLIPQANRWLYFVDDIYYAEKDSDVMDPYRITINIREANDGHFVYSYSAEKQEGQQKKLSVPIIRSGSDGTKSGELTQPSDNIVSRTEAERKSQKSFQEDQKYMAAVDSGDMDTAQKMVDDAAKRAFPNSVLIQDGKFRKMWHHTNKEFTEFLPGTSASSGGLKGIYFTPQESSNMANLGKIHKQYYLNVENMKFAFGVAADKKYVDQLKEMQKGITDREELAEVNRKFKEQTGVDAFFDWQNGWYNVMTPEQIKGADPVTYDDNGKVIPLSERFKKTSGDIRYSLQEEDEKYSAAVKAGNMDAAQRMVDEKAETVFAGSKVRGTDGKLLKMYHGTGAEFNEFRRDMIGSTGRFEGSGFNFTPYEGRAASYGKNVLAGYLNIQNPLSAEKKTLTVSKLAKLIRETDPTGDNIISDYARETRDYGKPSFISRESITAARALWEASDSDVDIYSFISAADSDAEGLIAAFEKLGYDGLIHYSDDGKIKTAVAFSSEQFKRADPMTYDDNGKEIPLSERFNTEKKDIRYSMQEDEEKYQAAVDAGDMKSAAKMVENAAKQNGYTMKVYHGTPTGGFTVFRDWSYFTENKDYADRYQSASASSIRGSYETTNPMTYALYMNPGKVFDTRKPAAAKLYNEARIEYGLGELSNTDSGLPDWTDGRDIIEFIEDRGLDYDTILLDEGGDPGENGPTKRGISYVTRANNVKNADPVTYDSKGKVVKLSERFNRKSNNIQFSMQEPVEVNKAGLIAVHNLTEQQLMATIDEGGFTAASIAVVLAKMGHSKFGPISAVFKPSAIDPKQSAKNRIYGADAFTPTRYNAKVHTKLINKGEQAVRQELQSVLKKVDESLRNEAFRWLSEKAYGEYTDESIEEWAEKAYNNVGMLAAYQADHGAEVKLSEKNVAAGIAKKERKDQYDAMFNGLYDAGKFDEFWDDIEKGVNRKEKINKYGELLAGIIPEIAESWNQYKETQKGTIGIRIWNWIEEFKDYMKYGFKETSVKDLYETRADLQKIVNEADFNEWFIDKFSRMFGEKGIWKNVDPFTASGESKSFRQTHLPYSAENVVRAMYNNVDRKGVSAYGASGLIASASKEYANLDEVRKDTARLQILDDEEYSKLVDELDAKMNDLAREISPDYPVGGMDAMIEAGKAYARNQSAAALKRAFAAQDFKLTDAQIAKAKELMDLAREFPTGYFEAKPERVSGFDELYKIIIPENAGDKMFRKLEENNIPYETYNGTEEDRLRILNEQTDAQFSFMDETDVDARAWMETVNENSLQTEAEKQLLRNFKSLRMRVSLKQEQERKIQEEIKRLKGVLNGNEGKGEETGAEIISMVEALKSVGIDVKYTKNGKWLMLGGLYNGTRIGKLAGKNKITLQRASEAVKMKLQDLGFTYDNVTLMWEYPNRTRKTMGNTEIERQLNALETRLEKATREKQAAQDELAKITSSNGYASLMYRQQRVLNDFVYGRTQDEVRGAVDRLEKSAANIAKRIEEEQRKAEEQAKNSVVQRFREILGTTTVDQTAAALKKRYNSTWTKNQLKVYLEPIILKMKAGEDFTADVETLAGILVNSDSTNTYEELSGLRGLVITLGPGAQKELRASNSSLKEIRARLAGTGIQVKFGERSSLETDIEDLRAEYPSIPELGDEKDALENFVSWVEGMKSQSAANEFYEQRIAEAMAVITQQAAGAAKGIYMPTDPKAAKQVLAMMEFVKGLNAETQAAQKMLQDVAKDMEELQKAGRQASGMAVTLTHDATTAIDYFNRMARIAEDQAKQKTRKDLIDQLKSDFAQKVAKNNEEWRNLIERDAKARKQAEKNMSSRGQINTVVKRLYDLLKNPKGTRNIPEHMQGLAREIVGVIVENDLSEMKHKISRIEKKNLMEAQRVLQAWEARDGKFDMSDLLNMDPENASMLVINQDLEQIYDGIEKYNQEIRGKNKLDTLQQRGEILTQIQEAMSEIYTAIRAEGEVFLRGRKVATEDAAAEVMNGTGGKKYREWTGTAGRALAGMHRAIVSGNMTPEYFFRTIGNKGLNDLWENYHAAENRNGLELAKAKARMDEIAKKHGYDKWDTKERRTVHLMNGDVQMTLGQIMALWATWNRENTLGPEMSNHLTGGGFYVEQQDLRDGLLGRTTVQKKAIKLAETDKETGYNPDVAALESLMTQEQKDYVNDIVQFMSNDMSALGNEASMAAYGIRMYKEKYYFPFQMWDGIKSRKSNEAAQGANVDRAFHPSFSKSRMHGANNALVIGDFTQTAADHVAGMINYATMGLANESLQKVLNQQVQEGGELDQTKRNIRVILEEAYGQEATQYLLELQRQLNGGAVRTSKSLGDKAISLFRKNAVAGSLSVALQQPLSYIRAAVMVNPKYLAAALNPATWKGSYQEMMAHSGVAVIKDMGRFDMNAGQSAREYLTPDELEGKAAKIWGQITDKATILPELMDRMTWTRMWSACKAEQAALHPEMDVKSDEFLDMVGERFNDLMRRTQVYDSVLVKSANMRSDTYWIKGLTSFMAEPTLTLNVLADAVREAASGAKGGTVLLAKAGATFILSAAMQAFFKGIMGSGRNPDEKKTWDENFLYRFWSNFISEADPLQLIPGFNDLVTILKEGKLEDDAMSALGKIVTAGRGTLEVLLGKGNKGVYRDLEDSVGQLAQLFTNLPAKNIMRDARAMYNFITQPYAKRPTSASVLLNQTKELTANADNMLGVINKWLGDAGYQTSNTAYYQRIYKAKKEGNEQAAQSMIDYLLTGKGVTEKAISSGVNSAAKKDTGATEAETAEFLINEGSTSADDYVTEQLKTGKITAEEARKLLKQAQPEKSDDDIWWTVDRIEYKQGTGAESISGKYYRLWDAMDANKADEIGEAVRIMTSHGMVEKNIKTEIGKHYKQAYLSGNSETKRKIKDAMQKAYRKLGFTAEDADKTISNWKKDAEKKK